MSRSPQVLAQRIRHVLWIPNHHRQDGEAAVHDRRQHDEKNAGETLRFSFHDEPPAVVNVDQDSASRLLTQEYFVAIQVCEEHARTPRTRRWLTMERHPSSPQRLVITDAIGSVQRQEREAARLLAYQRQIIGALRPFEIGRA